MQKIIVQIYEVQDPGEAEQLIELGVDHIGSVILDREKWCDPAIRDVVRLTAGTSAKSSLIPLFTAEDEVLRVLDYYEPDIIHFCENIPLRTDAKFSRTRWIEELYKLQVVVKEKFPKTAIIRSVPIPSPRPGMSPGLQSALRDGIAALVELFSPVSDFFMTDTVLGASDGDGSDALQPVTGFVGITGATCDWELAAWLVQTSPLPVILAGGLGPENVAEAISRTLPAGVDSCTRTNALDPQGLPVRFRKDFKRVQRLIAETRRAEKTCFPI
ncbi:MAG: hypothetical protein M0Q01_15825 [Syntrophales bacterium]|jgi:phosphoribosylanthranilate isomerase|nr:hypothetical protein [Syntrophales bacterium]